MARISGIDIPKNKRGVNTVNVLNMMTVEKNEIFTKNAKRSELYNN